MAFNRGKFDVGGGVFISYGNQSPAADAVPLEWKVGDRRYYVGGADPTLVGYECTVAGTPGTWVNIVTGGGPTPTPDLLVEQGVQDTPDNESYDEPVIAQGLSSVLTLPPPSPLVVVQGVEDTRDNETYDEPVIAQGPSSVLTLPPPSPLIVVHGVQDIRSNDEPDESIPEIPGFALEGMGGQMSGYDKVLVNGSRAFLSAQGLLAQSYDRAARSAAALIISGTVYYQACLLYKGDVVTNVVAGVVAASASATLIKLGLYSKAAVQLALSTSQHANWNAGAGLKVVPMITPYTVPATDLYYLALISVGGTQPTMYAHTTAAAAPVMSAPVGSGSAEMGVQTGQTDLPSPATIATTSGVAISVWLGAS